MRKLTNEELSLISGGEKSEIGKIIDDVTSNAGRWYRNAIDQAADMMCAFSGKC